ncbi:MAG: hypothetical protein H0X66_07435 [Verrucomicrobia bacterium]|jgi:hypothetical protein|nr:hypothetical protein [Verrucomicrobiota bacterium]
MSTTIYIELVDEGTQVWRPVEAEQVREGVFRIIGRQPEDEHWQFASGSFVRCRERTFSGGEHGFVAYEMATA